MVTYHKFLAIKFGGSIGRQLWDIEVTVFFGKIKHQRFFTFVLGRLASL